MTRARDVADTQDNVGGSVAPFVAGKNKILNSDFSIWQRGTSFTPAIAGNGTYTADRMWVYWDGTGTTTFSRQSFTTGTAPVTGYESTYYLRSAMSSGANFLAIAQKIEDVRTFAGQTVTLSFWAKATSSVIMNPLFRQDFGSGGSAVVDTYASSVTLTSSWARYSVSLTVPSIAGKTIGTSSFLQAYPFVYGSGTIASNTIDIWGIQLEAGSIATPFQTATGTLQGELAACQRYYYRHIIGQGEPLGIGWYFNSTTAVTLISLPVNMRTTPTMVATSGTDYYSFERNGGYDAFNSFILGTVNNKMVNIYNASEVSGTGGQAGYVFSNNASSSLAFSAEL